MKILLPETTHHKGNLKHLVNFQWQYPSISYTRLYLEIEAVKGIDCAKAIQTFFFFKE